MKKYLLLFIVFSSFIYSYFVLNAQQNIALAAKIIPPGQGCYTSQGCGTSTEVCVPDGKMCGNPGFQVPCDTGKCRAKTATSGKCDPTASVCDASKGYVCKSGTCQQQVQAQPNTACTGTVGTQGNCTSGNLCKYAPGSSLYCGQPLPPAGTTCNTTCQPQSKPKTGCTGTIGTQGSCTNGYLCQYAPGSSPYCGQPLPPAGTVCNTTCLQQTNKGSCTGTPGTQGSCTNGNICNWASGSSLYCGQAGAPAGTQNNCKLTCQTRGQLNGTCEGTAGTQGTCGSGLICDYKPGSPSTCGSIVDNGNQCSLICQNPQQPPTTAPTLPPPPSPPCVAWANGQCQTFNTTFGAFPTDPSGFITRIFAILLSVSGGIAALLIIKAGYQLMTSQGKPEQLQAGRDQLIAAIVGLVFLIFSFALLQIIGFNILHIPGFGGGAGGGGGAANNTGTTKGQSCNVFTTKCATGLTCKPNSTGGTLGTCQ